MDPANLLKLAAARGVDFDQVGGTASNTKGQAKRRTRTRLEIDLGIDVHETVSGRSTRTYRQPAWTISDLGQASAGVGQIPWAAALYSYAGHRDDYWKLWNALSVEAQRVARRENWAPRVAGEDGRPVFYREQLAMLVLDEDAYRWLFMEQPAIYALYMGLVGVQITPAVWDQSLSGPFRSLKSSYGRWLEVARAFISRRIREPDHTPELDNADSHG